MFLGVKDSQILGVKDSRIRARASASAWGSCFLGVKDSKQRIPSGIRNLGCQGFALLPILGQSWVSRIRLVSGENFECVFDSELHKTLV